MDSKDKKPPYENITFSWVFFGIGFGIVYVIFGGMMAGGTMLMITFSFVISVFGPIINYIVLKIQSKGGVHNTPLSIAFTALFLTTLFFLLAGSGIFNYT